MQITVVIPVFNEAESLAPLVEEISGVAEGRYSLQIILIDDGSTDASWQQIQQLTDSCPFVSGIRLRRNFGKSEALQAGFREARGDVIVTLDADLQDDPHVIPQFLAKLDEGWDVVSGWKQQRRDPWTRRISSKIFNGLVNSFSRLRLHDHNCGFKCYRPEVVRELKIYGELHRFVPVLADSLGFKVTEVPVPHRARRFGRSKYGWRRIPTGLVDILTVSFLVHSRGRPQHILGLTGLGIFAAATLGTVWLATTWVVSRQFEDIPDVHLHERALFYFCLAGLLLGAQLVSLGFLAELVAWMFYREHPPFSVAERTGDHAFLPEPESQKHRPVSPKSSHHARP